MTTHQLPTTSTGSTGSTGHPTPSAAPVPTGRSIVRRLWQTVRAVGHGIDASALVAHGREVPPDHPARRRRLDHEEVERRLTELYPRT